ncbi:MAG: ATP-binding cassette domain-containing protein, partial [Actinobacteria bacterium]|nr:ATP-binding cassette domain-containing protein [Actinomycetota bacterium]
MRLRVGRLDLDVDVRADAGEVLALIGPNGSGKSTTLRVLAGLSAVQAGRVVVGGAVCDDPATRTFVLPEHRRVGMVFQDHLLFPHLDLTENVAFGLRVRGERRDAARGRAVACLDQVGIGDLAGARPAEVSGGQAQRAALARALVTEPALLLLDEPLAALDVATRTSLRRELRSTLTGFGGATVLVTHDALDVLALADRVVVVEDGRVTQIGTLQEVTTTPRTTYVAELMGTNLLAGCAEGSRVVLDRGGSADSATSAAVLTAEAHRGPVLLLIRPSSVSLQLAEPTGSPRNRWPATVAGIDVLVDRVRVRLDGPVPLAAEVTPS